MPKKALPLVEQLTKELLGFAETALEEGGARRYFRAKGVELAVIFVDHGRLMADILAPRPGGTSGAGARGLAERVHAGRHREGWVLVPIEGEEDVKAAVELARMGYEDILGQAPAPAVRKERPLESFAAGSSKRRPSGRRGAKR